MDETNTPLDYHIRVKPNSWLNNEWTWGRRKSPRANKLVCKTGEDVTIQRIKTGQLQNVTAEDIEELIRKEQQDCDLFSNCNSLYVPQDPGNFSAKKKLNDITATRFTSHAATAYLTAGSLVPVSSDEPHLENTPEQISKFMFMTENVADPTIEPLVHFNTLFEPAKYGEMLNMSPVSDGHFQDVVVPLDRPERLPTELQTLEVRHVSGELKKSLESKAQCMPKDNIVKDLNVNFSVDSNKIQSALNYEDLEEINECCCLIKELIPAMQAIGAEPQCVLEPADVKDEETKKETIKKGIQYFIETPIPARVSKVRTRGSDTPHFFPGFVYADPNHEEPIRIAKSPSEVFRNGWKFCNPKNFDECSIVHLQKKKGKDN